jgi:hypothetical protein
MIDNRWHVRTPPEVKCKIKTLVNLLLGMQHHRLETFAALHRSSRISRCTSRANTLLLNSSAADARHVNRTAAGEKIKITMILSNIFMPRGQRRLPCVQRLTRALKRARQQNTRLIAEADVV